MRAIVYVRVSTDKQDAAAQLPALLKLCAARGWETDVRTEVASGAKMRPVLDKACNDARCGEAGVLVVWALDRLGRDLWEIIPRVRSLWASGIRLVSIQDAWTEGADGPVRDLLLMLLAWVATFERQRLRARTREGVARARAKGKILGRPRVSGELLDLAVRDVVNGRTVLDACAGYEIGEGTLRRALRARCAP